MTTSSTHVRGNEEKGFYTPRHDDPGHCHLSYLLQEMKSVDLRQLYTEVQQLQRRLHAPLSQGRGRGTRRRGAGHHEEDVMLTGMWESERTRLPDWKLAEHILCFLQHFLECADTFLLHAEASLQDCHGLRHILDTLKNPIPRSHGACGRSCTATAGGTTSSHRNNTAGLDAPSTSHRREKTTKRAASIGNNREGAHEKEPPLQASHHRTYAIRERRRGGSTTSSSSTTTSPKDEEDELHIVTRGAGRLCRQVGSGDMAGLYVNIPPLPQQSLLHTMARAVKAQRSSSSSHITVVLEPGIYRECLRLEPASATRRGGTLELAAGPAAGAAALLYRRRADQPILDIRGSDCVVHLRGLVLVDDCEEGEEGEESVLPAPILRCSEGARVVCEECHFYGNPRRRCRADRFECAASLMEVTGPHTSMTMSLCLFSYCRRSAQIGSLVRGGSRLCMSRCKVRHCGVGLRVTGPGSTLFLEDSLVEHCLRAGVLVDKGGAARLQRCSIVSQQAATGRSEEEAVGLELRDGATAEVAETRIEKNRGFGIRRVDGTYLHLQRSYVRENGINVATI